MRHSVKSSLGESIKGKSRSDQNVSKGMAKKSSGKLSRKLFKTYQSNAHHKSQEFSFTNDPNISRNSALHTHSSNEESFAKRLPTKESLDLSMTSSKLNYSSNHNFEEIDNLQCSFTSRPGTARAKSTSYHSFKTPAEIVQSKEAISPTASKENKAQAPKWKYSYKKEIKLKEFKTTTGFRK